MQSNIFGNCMRKISLLNVLHYVEFSNSTFAENKQYCSPNFRKFIANLNDSCTAYYFKWRWRYSSDKFRSEAILTSHIGFPGYSKLLCCVHSCLTDFQVKVAIDIGSNFCGRVFHRHALNSMKTLCFISYLLYWAHSYFCCFFYAQPRNTNQAITFYHLKSLWVS